MGYCQGLNFLAAIFILYLNDEVEIKKVKKNILKDSFKMMCKILERENLLETYRNLGNLKKNFFVYEELMKKYLPKIYFLLVNLKK